MSAPTPDEPTHDRLDERPPLLGSWRTLYGVTLLALAGYIALGAVVTWVFAP